MLKNGRIVVLIFSFLVCTFSHHLTSAQTPTDSGPGIGPIKELKLEELSEDLSKKGKDVFSAKCAACHKMSERYVGPALGDVFKKRRPEWIMNMILNPVEMTQKDPVALELLGEYLTQMTFQNVSTEEARSLLEYFRRYAEKGEIAEPKKLEKTSKKKTK